MLLEQINLLLIFLGFILKLQPSWTLVDVLDLLTIDKISFDEWWLELKTKNSEKKQRRVIANSFWNLFLFDERVVMVANNIVVMKKKEKNEVHIGCQPL